MTNRILMSAVAVAFAIGCGSSSGSSDAGGKDVVVDQGQVKDMGFVDTITDKGQPSDPGTGKDTTQPQDPGKPTDPGKPNDPGGVDISSDTGGKHHPADWLDENSNGFHGREAVKGLAACQACHGAGLDGGNAGVSCDTCHGGWKTNCTFCHGGTDNKLGSPPEGVLGATATTEVNVGAHTSHVSAASGISPAFDCTECHDKPADALTPGHIDPSPAEVNGHGWDHAAETCSSAYCHGNFTGGNSANHPKWTAVGSGQAACGTCHALPPKTGRHPSNWSKHSWFMKDCSNCHEGIADNTGSKILDASKHVNGAKDVKIKNGTWNAGTKTCNPACHGSEKW